MRVAGLFAGVGGFEVGFARSAHEMALLCEVKPEAIAVLRARIPGADIHPNIVDLSALPANIELVCAGFPCQDLSQAGRTNGLAGENSGLIHHVFRLLDKKPRVPWLVLENVPFMLQLGGGGAMRSIVQRLEELGYRWAYRVVDTFAFGLPQRRERVFLVASIDGSPEDVILSDDRPLERPDTDLASLAHGFYWTEGKGGLGWAVDSVPTLKNGSTIGIPSPPAILMPSGEIVKPDIRDAERLQGFPADWTKPAESVARASFRWSLVGSAVSVPVSEWIGRRLSEPGEFDGSRCRDFPSSGKLPRAAFGGVEGRCGVEISTDPLGLRPMHLHSFMQYQGTPLSPRATKGFHNRAMSAKLNFARGFLPAVERHLEAVSRQSQLLEAISP